MCVSECIFLTVGQTAGAIQIQMKLGPWTHLDPVSVALHTLNQRVNRLVNHLVKCVRVARSPDHRLKLT